LSDLERTAPDAHVIAVHIADSAKAMGNSPPAAEDLTHAITDVLPESHMTGSSVVKVMMHDERLELLRSGFFSSVDGAGNLSPATKKQTTITTSSSGKPLKRDRSKLVTEPGRLDPIEINYPEGSKYWWRLSTVSAVDDGTLTLTFIDRIADELQTLRGPYKANRATMTRAEFLKLVAGKVPEIRFHSTELDLREPIDPVDIKATVPSTKSKHGKKHKGLAANYKDLTVKGFPMGKRQAENANLLIAQAQRRRASERVTVAIVFAGIWESNLEVYADNGTYWGVLSGAKQYFLPPSGYLEVTAMADAFLMGGKGFKSAIYLGNPGPVGGGLEDPAAIASQAEGASPYDSKGVSRQYEAQSDWPGVQVATDEAKAIVQAAGGSAAGGDLSTGPTVETVQPYFFQIGTSSNRGESLWDGMQRLAQEVNWSLFTDGPDLYYDSQTALIKQKVARVLSYGDADILNWNYDWNSRQVATQFTVTLLCDPFEYRSGDVFMVQGFGIDDSSTAKRPGAWLVQDVIRQPMSFSSQFTLAQPQPQKNEPAPQTASVGKGALSHNQAKQSKGGKTGITVTNPAPGASAGRLDMGCDGGYGPLGVVAPFDGKVYTAGEPGWPGENNGVWTSNSGPYFYIVNDDQHGPDYTQAMYFAEGAIPVVGNGSHVTAGTKIGQPVRYGGTGDPGNFEIGPAAVSNGAALAAAKYGSSRSGPGAGAVDMVKAFADWIQSAGFPTPTDTSHAGWP
jgi:hypothetical protein